MRNIIVLAVATFVVLTCGCSSQKQQTLNDAEKIINQYPDSALKLLQKYNVEDFTSRSQKAHYALLLTQALDKNYIDVRSDSTIMIAVDYYTHRGSILNRTKAYFYLGRIYKYAKDYGSAIAALVKAEDYAEEIDDFYLKALIHVDKGWLYENQFSFKEAIDEYTKSLDLCKQIGDSKYTMAVLNARARVYNCENMLEESINDNKHALEIALAANDTAAILNQKSRIVSVEFQIDKDGRKAIDQLHKLYKQYNNGHVPVNERTKLCRYYWDCNMLDSARYFGMQTLNNRNVYSDIGFTGIYNILIDIEEKCGNKDKALAYSKTAMAMLDSVYFNEKQRIVQELEHNNRVKLQIEKNEALRNVLLYQWLSLCLTVTLAAILLWLMGKKLKSRSEKLVESQAYIETLQQNFKHLSAQLNAVNTHLNTEEEKNLRLCSAFSNKLNSIKDLLQKSNRYKPDEFVQKFHQNMQINSSGSVGAFSDLLDVANIYFNGVVDYLRKQYDSLTDEDLRLCCLICFGFSSNDFMLLYDYTNPRSVYTKRYRLRKKLGLSGNDNNLEIFIYNTLSDLGSTPIKGVEYSS